MSKKSDAPPAPNYGPLIEASTRQSERMYELQREQFEWAREAYAQDRAISDQVSEQFLQAQQFNQANAEEDRRRWEDQFRPVEDRFVSDAMSYDSPERRQFEQGRAMANVAQQFDAARAANLQKLESYGIDPSATRYGALDLGLRTQQAAAAAAASNQAGMAVDAQGNAMRGQAIQLGRQSLGQGMGMQQIANQSGTGAVNTNLATTASGAGTMGTSAQYAGLGGQAIGMAGNLMNTQHQNELAAYKAEGDGGVGAGLGLIGGLLTAPKSSILGAFLEDGGSVPDDYPTPGGAVPMQASPSAGREVDDVNAKLTAGEFVIPKDVTSWKGEEFFQKMIEQARKQKQGAGAKPQMGPMAPGPATFTSRPQQGSALPLR